MKKVIFLDMDGVLCTPRVHFANRHQGLWTHLDSVACKLVERLSVDCKAEIVISSTWRQHFERLAMNSILCNGGFSNVNFHQCWKTPKLPGEFSSRGDEIELWLCKNGRPQYVILDDDSDMLQEQLPYFVKTDPLNGFMWEHYEKAEKILKASWPAEQPR